MVERTHSFFFNFENILLNHQLEDIPSVLPREEIIFSIKQFSKQVYLRREDGKQFIALYRKFAVNVFTKRIP